MNTPDEKDTSPADDETRKRSAEQRNVTAPTPEDVRDDAEDDEDQPSDAGPDSDDQ